MRDWEGLESGDVFRGVEETEGVRQVLGDAPVVFAGELRGLGVEVHVGEGEEVVDGVDRPPHTGKQD